MKITEKIVGSIRNAKERLDSRMQIKELNKLKQKLESREKQVLPLYEKVIKREPERDGGHLISYPKVSERYKRIDEERKATDNTAEERKLIVQEINAINFALKEIEEAADHIANTAANRFMDQSTEAKEVLNSISNGGK